MELERLTWPFKSTQGIDDLPQRANTVRLSSRRDPNGIPYNRVSFRGQTDYFERAVRHLVDDLPRRLRPLGAGRPDFDSPVLGGAHISGTLRMGLHDGVVDRDLRHRSRSNLFVSGASVFPTFSPAHPTLTIGALAVRLGRMLASEPV